MTIDTTSFGVAIAQLDEALAYAGSDLARADPRLALHLRAAAIQAFEFTYELSVRTLRRYLLATEPSPAAIDELDFNGLIRLGYARALLKSHEGDTVDLRTPGGIEQIEVLEIRYEGA